MSSTNLRTDFTPFENGSRTFCPFQTFESGISLPVLAVTPADAPVANDSQSTLVGIHALSSICKFVENFSLQRSPQEPPLTFTDVCAQRLGPNCVEPFVCTALKDAPTANTIKIQVCTRFSILFNHKQIKSPATLRSRQLVYDHDYEKSYDF